MGVCGDVIGPMQRKPGKAGQSSCAHTGPDADRSDYRTGDRSHPALPYGVGIPDQYGRRWDGDDGESDEPPNPGTSDLRRCTHGEDNSL